MLTFPLRGRRHWQRYRDISQILLRHGFDQLVDVLELAPFVSLPARWLRQRRTSEDATGPQRLRRALEELGPTFIKLGQILSTRPDLAPPDYIAELTKLQDSAPPFPSEEARALIESELGRPVMELFTSFDDTPVAAASLGQVHRAVLLNGERVVVKVQRPDIQERIKTDLEILLDLARLAQDRTPLGQYYDLASIAEEFGDTLRAELDYQREGRNADRFRHNFAGDPAIYVPRVYWSQTTRRVLVLEELQGYKINDLAALDAGGIDRHRLAIESARLIVKQVFVDHFFHADPHPGNFYVLPPIAPDQPPRIGVMDFGQVGWIDDKTRERLLRMMVSVVRQDTEGIVDEFIRMGVVEWGDVDRPRLERDLRGFLNRYRGQPLQEWSARQVMSDSIPIAFRHHLRFPSELWLLGKTLAMSEGLGRQLAPDFDLFAVAEPYARQLYLESVSPREMSQRAVESMSEWGEELFLLPQQMRRMIERMERGAFQVSVRDEGRSVQMDRWDRIANRLTASLLIAAFIIAVSMLVPLLTSEFWRVLAGILIALGFVNATLLTLWLITSTWFGGKK
ncbi:MAG: AarF/ABC1/UbiB kinase family protein [Anaerolineae bacterium]